MQNNTATANTKTACFITPEAMLEQWQGHRRLTRRVISAFPEDKLFTYSIGGMRPFAELAMEMLRMTVPSIQGIVSGRWATFEELSEQIKSPGTREELLELWDASTTQLEQLWPLIAAERFQENIKLFNMYEGILYWNILYLVDNEIHHRGQGYVYLRSLGIEPPAFWDRN